MEVDFLLLTDGAHVAGDKLYVLGGGWTVVWARQFPIAHRAALAVGMMVDWQETNQRHSVEIVLISEDGEQMGGHLISGNFEVGRPPGIPVGTAQRFMLAGDFIMNLESTGSYEIVVRIDGSDSKRTSFSAIQVPQAAAV